MKSDSEKPKYELGPILANVFRILEKNTQPTIDDFIGEVDTEEEHNIQRYLAQNSK